MKKNLFAATLVVVSLSVLAGCSSTTGREVKVEMSNYKLSPEVVEVKTGETVQFVLNNVSDTDHEFESDEGKLEELVVPPGKSRTVSWTAPKKAGEYEFECDMTGHDGMEMTVKVVD